MDNRCRGHVHSSFSLNPAWIKLEIFSGSEMGLVDPPSKRHCKIKWKTLRAQAKQWRVGPDNCHDLTAWEVRNRLSLFDNTDTSSPERKALLRAILHGGVWIRTLFSGTDCAREAFERQFHDLQAVFPNVSDTCVSFDSTTDKGTLQTQVLVKASLASGAKTCHFGIFFER